MFIIIDIYSKNFKSLKNFLLFFNNKNIFHKFKILIIKTDSKKPLKKFIITVLKSPHVNKSAQEQFEFKVYKKRLKLFVPQISMFLIFLKKLKTNLFADIKFKLNIISNTKINKKKIKNKININNYKLCYKELNLIKYLKILEILGEYSLKVK